MITGDPAIIGELRTGTVDFQTGEVSYTWRSKLKNIADPATAVAFLRDNSDVYYEDAQRISLSVEELGGGVWQGTTQYKQKTENGERPVTGSIVYEADTTGGSTHITTSLQTVSTYAVSGSAPSFNRVIGVQTDGEPQGVDIVDVAFRFSVTRYMAWSDFSQGYEDALANLTGKTNAGTWTATVNRRTMPNGTQRVLTRTYSAESVLFLGARISERKEEDDVAIQLSFERRPQKTSITIGEITNINAAPHDYIWTLNVKSVTDNKSTPKALYAYVERVYDRANFSGLLP